MGQRLVQRGEDPALTTHSVNELRQHAESTYSELLRTRLRDHTLLAAVAYHVPFAVSLLGYWLDVTRFNPWSLLLIYLVIVSMAVFFVRHIAAVPDMTRRRATRIMLAEICVYIALFIVWTVYLGELRSLALLCSLLPFTFVFSLTSLAASTSIIFIVSTAYIAITYMALRVWEQNGSLTFELLFVCAFIGVSLFIAYMGNQFRAESRKLRSSRRVLQEKEDELQRVVSELRKAAGTDFLTGLPNRRAAASALHKERRRADEKGMVLAICDLDHFKQINDTWGHEAGDQVLVEVGRRVAGLLRSSDTLARWGGEEFLLLLKDVDEATGRSILERVRSVIAAAPISFGEHELRVTASIGFSPLDRDDDAERALQEADAALYRAKGSGRNRVLP